ncbi:MAG: prolyl oligopeptidase family serine peptidase [Bacteroidales bacterium]|nr:prolyl oligopeptidase family serine peptidase [Bacteroidales bacterium]
MKKTISILAASAAFTSAMAAGDTLSVASMRHFGPVPVYAPCQLDTTDVNGKKFETQMLHESAISLGLVKEGKEWSGVEAPGADTTALHLMGCTISNSDYFTGSLNLTKSPKHAVVYLDGKKQAPGALTLNPGTHELVVQYFSTPREADSLQINLSSDSAAHVPATALRVGDIAAKEGKMYTIEQLVKASSYSGYTLSPNGKWMLLSYFDKSMGNDGQWLYYLVDRTTGAKSQLSGWASWMPKSNRFYVTRNVRGDRQLVTIDPATRAEEVWAHNLPEGSFQMFPTEDRLLFTIPQEGPKELNPDAFELIHPDDRQPGWRNRQKYAVYDRSTGLLQPITFGYSSHYVSSISNDGKKLLVTKREDRLTARPTTLSSVFVLDLATLTTDTLVSRDGFVSGGTFSPDDKTVLLQGSPEAFNRIGCTLPDSVTPNMYDYQLYTIDIASKKVNPITRDFNPSITGYDWSAADGKIYFTAEDKDLVSLFQYDPKTAKFTKLEQPEEVVSGFNLAAAANVISFAGESNDHSWRLYTMDLSKKKPVITQMGDINAELYAGVSVDPCESWTCTNSIGDEVCCRFYRPANFDPAKKYPMIVYYYGGCSPTSRYFEYTYPQQIWAANGYAVLVVNPSGASGFGQEWGSRHVNTAGVDPARDIIECTKQFCKEHEWVNADRLGCIGASYGGFMTQYLQTVTDIFRCAVSHAGISDHSNYWGYGYWGYSYSEVSMANSYPWTRKDLYVEESPLYNVDKVKSSMLFLHGTDDTNVPYNNSVQMYTALRLLGQDVAFVSIEGENHGIRDPRKRILWHNATMAWFARCLKDDPTWWNALYPKKTL